MKFNFFAPKTNFTSTDEPQKTPTMNGNSAAEPLSPQNHRLHRQVTIEEEPDSLDSVICNPQSYPITIVPNRPASFYGYSPSGKPYNRQSSSSMHQQLAEVQVLKEVDENGVEKEEVLTNQWKRQYMRGISATPSQGGVYYEALKGSHSSLAKGSRNYRPGSMRKVRRRAVFKNGDCNVLQKNLMRRRLRFMQDMYTTLVDSQWRWTLLVFALSFILSWLLFAVLWWLIMYTHGDLEELHLPHNQEETGWQPCVSAINGFTSCFLFSIETQHTIGYGVRTTSEACPEAIFMMCFQSIYGVMSSAFMAGIVFAKMTRAKQRAQTLLFSKNAVICQRDGCLSLMFRVGDMRKSLIIGAGVRAQLIRTRSTKEGEVMSQHFTELEICADECGSDLFFIWPMVIEHKIDENSPLYNMSATDLLQDKFEIVVILEGTVESTGQSTQARSSYVNTEILWGHRFDPVVVYNKERQAYEIDYARFNETTQVDTPLCSSRELNEYYKIQDGFRTPDIYRRSHQPLLPHSPLSLDARSSGFCSVSSTHSHDGRALRFSWRFSNPQATAKQA